MISTPCGNETRRAKCVRCKKESKNLMRSTPPLQEQQTGRAFGLSIPYCIITEVFSQMDQTSF